MANRQMGKAHLDALANLTLRCNRNEPICFSLIRVYRARDLVERRHQRKRMLTSNRTFMGPL